MNWNDVGCAAVERVLLAFWGVTGGVKLSAASKPPPLEELLDRGFGLNLREDEEFPLL